MSLRNLYLGQTLLPGASYLDSRAYINIKEGYDIGGSIHYADLGQYEIQEMENSGPDRQTVSLTVSDRRGRMDSNNSPLQRTFHNLRLFRDEFNDPATLNTSYQFTTSNWGISSNGLLIANMGTTDTRTYFYLTDETDFSDVRLLTKVNSNGWGIRADAGIVFRNSDDSMGLNQGYFFRYEGLSNYSIDFIRQDGASSTTLGSVGLSLGNNTSIWLMVIADGPYINTYYSTNGYNFTLHTAVNQTGVSAYRKGRVGLTVDVPSSGVAQYRFDYVDFAELNGRVSTEEILKQSLALGSVFDVNVQNDYKGYVDMSSPTGSSFVNTSGVLLYRGPGTGASWDLFMTTGSSFSDFILEADITGSSSTSASLVVGHSDNFYTAYNTFRPTLNTALEHFYGNSRYTFRRSGDHMNLREGIKYNFKLIKSNTSLMWFVNDRLMNAGYGLSLIDTTAVDIGFAVFNDSGSTILFENMRVSALDSPLDNVILSPNTPISSMYDRYFPQGYADNWTTNSVNIFRIGASRGEISIGLSHNKWNTSQAISNVAGSDKVLVKSERSSGVASTTNTRNINQVDSNRIRFLNEDGIDNRTDANNFADSDILVTNKDITPVSVDIKLKPTLELYDKVNFVDDRLGVSKQLIVYNMTKEFSADNGEFTESLELG